MDYVWIGAAVLAALWGAKAYFESRENKKLAEEIFEKTPPTLNGEEKEEPQTQFEMKFDEIEEISEAEADIVPEQPAEKPQLEPDLIVVQLMSRPNKVFQGLDLQKALSDSPLQFDSEKCVYELFVQDQDKPIIIAVNQQAPGRFPEKMGTDFSTQGLSFLLPLPSTHESNVQSFEAMLALINQINSQLDGLVCNDRGRLLTDQQLDQMQAKVEAYDA